MTFFVSGRFTTMHRLCVPLCGLLAVLLIPSGCTSLPTPHQRTLLAEQLASTRDWHPITVPTNRFRLRAYGPEPNTRFDTLRVYIEGDGLAWITPSRPSVDPTPIHPTGLALALADPAPNTVYLARPCQYVDDPHCTPKDWLQGRFSSAVIDSTVEALDALKRRYKANHLRLTGYSGGAAVAILAAARRSDIEALISVAGNLETDLWTRHHRISPLTGSLNPADSAAALHGLPQWHFVGARDRIIPPIMAQAYATRFPPSAPLQLLIKPDYDHHCCWVEHWPTLLQEIAPEQERDRTKKAPEGAGATD